MVKMGWLREGEKVGGERCIPPQPPHVKEGGNPPPFFYFATTTTTTTTIVADPNHPLEQTTPL